MDAYEGGKHRPGTGPCKGGWLSSKYPMIGAHGDWTSEWATFQLDWTETWITMSVNGKLYANCECDNPPCPAASRSAVSDSVCRHTQTTRTPAGASDCPR